MFKLLCRRDVEVRADSAPVTAKLARGPSAVYGNIKYVERPRTLTSIAVH